MTWEASVRKLIARGREQYPDSTTVFIAAIRIQHPYDDLDAPIAALPDECRTAAERILPVALARGATHQAVRDVAVAADAALAAEYEQRMAAYQDACAAYGGYLPGAQIIDGRSGDCF